MDVGEEKRFEVVKGPTPARTSASHPGYWATNYSSLPVVSGAETERVRWVCTTLPAGNYEVHVWWSAAASRSKSAPYVVKNGAIELDTVRLDQTSNGGSWQLLSIYTFDSGQHVVELHNGESKSTDSTAVCADAVKFVRVGD